MGLFPKIQSPCPYKGRLSDVMDGDICRLCKREVFDLTEMGDDGRLAFLRGCEGDVCVSYKVLTKSALTAAMAGAAAIGFPNIAAAQDGGLSDDEAMGEIIVGGISARSPVHWMKYVTQPELFDLTAEEREARRQRHVTGKPERGIARSADDPDR